MTFWERPTPALADRDGPRVGAPILQPAAAGQAKLAADREQHAATVAAARAALEARTTVLAKREADLAAREGRQAHYDKLISRWKQQRDFPDIDIQPGSSLRREPAHG